MCPFLLAFRSPLIKMLSTAEETGKPEIAVSEQVKKDLMIWYTAIEDCEKGLPIPCEPCQPNIWHKTVAVSTLENKDMQRRSGKAGLGCYCSNEDGEPMLSFCYLWEISEAIDLRIAEESESLLFMGMLLALLKEKDQLRNQHIVINTCNITCSWAWEKKYEKNSEMASALIRCLAIMSAYLGSYIHIEYRKQPKCWEEISAEKISRNSGANSSCPDLSVSSMNSEWPVWAVEWLKKPRIDWSLADKLRNHLL